ncbi:right-handed parallel beta-helix repeat-containing protein [Candidatus Dojkabacteria bacterium]|nr:right-handed parallel beta-helix repeat-containing protein [Candidatus Dojkabacteria bacterium]
MRNYYRYFILLISISFFTILSSKHNPVYAAEITVNTTVESAIDGLCSLREAITAANTNAVVDGCSAGDDATSVDTRWGTFSVDRINVPAGSYVLTLIGSDETNAAGDLDILSNIWIEGASSSTTIIDGVTIGGTNERVFDVDNSVEFTRFNNIRVQNGAGNIYIGATYSEITYCYINSSTMPAAALGGGIYADGSYLDILNTTITLNNAVEGAGIYLENGTARLAFDYIDLNTATTLGGGIFIDSDASALIGSMTTFFMNEAAMGGGMYNEGNVSYDGESDWGMSFLMNNATMDGGGIYIAGTGSLFTAPNPLVGDGFTVIASNDATTSGGGIYNAGTSVLNRVRIYDNTSGSMGGGIYDTSWTTVILYNSEVLENVSTNGGGLYVSGGVTYAERTTIAGNFLWGQGSGAGAYLNTGGLHLLNSTVSSNVDDGIYATDASELTMDYVTLTNHSGMGLDIQWASTADIQRSIIDGTCNIISATVTSSGYNIETGDTCGLNQPSDRTGVAAALLALGPLQMNGGSTDTHALGASSIAVDSIANADCGDMEDPMDQRGSERPSPPGGRCDAGAYELLQQVPEQPILPETGESVLKEVILGIAVMFVFMFIVTSPRILNLKE